MPGSQCSHSECIVQYCTHLLLHLHSVSEKTNCLLQLNLPFASAEMQTIFEAHLDFIDENIKSQSWQDAFCRWVAVVMAARREPHWWEDTDMPGKHLGTRAILMYYL